jgi:hypothetical protein
MVLAIYQIILHLNKITECLKMTTFKIVFTFDGFFLVLKPQCTAKWHVFYFKQDYSVTSVKDAKWVAKTHKSNDGQYNGKDKKTNNRPENTKQRTKDCIIRTSLKPK